MSRTEEAIIEEHLRDTTGLRFACPGRAVESVGGAAGYSIDQATTSASIRVTAPVLVTGNVETVQSPTEFAPRLCSPVLPDTDQWRINRNGDISTRVARSQLSGQEPDEALVYERFRICQQEHEDILEAALAGESPTCSHRLVQHLQRTVKGPAGVLGCRSTGTAMAHDF